MKYLVALTAAATVLLTPGCLEQKVDDYPIPPQLESDAKGMIVNNEVTDTTPVVSSQKPDEIKLLLYSITPAPENYY